MQAAGIGQPAHDLLRRIPGGQLLQAHVAVPLAQAAAVRRKQKGQVVEPGRGQAQRFVQPKLSRSGRQQICAAHHLRDPHEGVVHHHGQLVSVHPVAPAQVKVAAVGGQIFFVMAQVAVGETDHPVGHLHPPGGRLFQRAAGDLFGRKAPAGAGVHHLAVRPVGGAGGVQLAAAAKAGVDKAEGVEFIIILFVYLKAFALVIGAVRPAGAAALVPAKAQPGKVLLQQVSVGAGAAGSVQILNAKHHLAAACPGAEPGQQAAHQIAQMHPAGRGGSKTAFFHERGLLSGVR